MKSSTEDPANLIPPPSLVSYVRDGRCALFVGAGLSRPAGYPGWSRLMTEIVRQVVPDSQRSELSDLLNEGKFAEVADQCRQLLGRPQFYRLVRSLLGAPAEPPEATHRPIVDTPWKCIVTTNFDTLLEDAYFRWSDRGIPRTPTGTQLMHHGTLLLDGGFFILKAHGTLEDTSSMVFTSEDYRRITHANPAFTQMLSAILLSNAVLFVGYSLSDPNFRLLLEAQLSTFGAEVPRRYILMEATGQTEEELLWRTARVRVLSYPKGQHELVALFLASLARSVRDTAARRPPRRETDRQLAVKRVLRLELSARYSNLDVTWSRIDMEGSRTANLLAAIPVAHGSGVLPAWQQLHSILKKVNWTTYLDESRFRNLARRMGALLWRALPVDLRRELAMRDKDVVILAPSPTLECLPWEWIAIDGVPLFVCRPVVREPGDISNTARGRPFVGVPPRLLLIGDSGSGGLGLPASRREVQKLASLAAAVLPKANITLLVGRAASHDRVLSEIESGDHDLVHFTGHVGTNGGEAFLLLYDGYVQGSDLITLLSRRPPAVFVVNGRGAFNLPFENSSHENYEPSQPTAEVLDAETAGSKGLAWAASRAGVGAFVGGFGFLTDENAAQFGIAFYQRLFSGQAVAQAFWSARSSTHRTNPDAYFFVLSGYPDLVLCSSKGPRA